MSAALSASHHRTPSLGSPLRAFGRLFVYLSFTLSLMPVQALALALRHPLRTELPLWYHRQCCKILGFKIERRGRQSRAHPTLYVANHASYFDIMVLASLIRGSFVAKTEVARWPLFGQLAKLQRTVFVDRRRAGVARQGKEIAVRLRAGDNLILFPEGTSDDGNRVLPFKSALFAAVEGEGAGQALTIQPVSIAYTRLDGMPMGRYLRPFFAWYGDMEMSGHLWRALGLGRVTVVVHFHPPLASDAFPSRKALSDYCFEQVAAGVSAALAGRSGKAAEARAEEETVPARQPMDEVAKEAPTG